MLGPGRNLAPDHTPAHDEPGSSLASGYRMEILVRPVLFSVLGIDVQTHGASKVLAALVGAYLLARAFDRAGLRRDSAYSLVMWATLWGFVGAKIYYLLENAPDITWHHLGGAGFTWYGGFVAGLLAALVIVRRHRLPLGVVAGAIAVPLTLAYGIGRLGCLISGDGTYGRPTDVPWGMRFPSGVVATNVPVHPTPLYEALAALVIAAILWSLGTRWNPPAVFGAYLALSGIARFLVEFLRTNEPAVIGLTQPQLWALASIGAGTALIVHARPTRSTQASAARAPLADEPAPATPIHQM